LYGGIVLRKTPDGLPEPFIGLPKIGIQFMFEMMSRLHFGHFHREGCSFSGLGVPRMQRKCGFILKPCLIGYFPCLNSVFRLLALPRGYFFAIIRQTESFPSLYPSSKMKLQLFEQLPLQLRQTWAMKQPVSKFFLLCNEAIDTV